MYLIKASSTEWRFSNLIYDILLLVSSRQYLFFLRLGDTPHNACGETSFHSIPPIGSPLPWDTLEARESLEIMLLAYRLSKTGWLCVQRFQLM